MRARQASNAAGWKTFAIFASLALVISVTVFVSVSVYSGKQVRTITRSHLLVGNDTAWYDYTNVARVGVKRLCFSNDTYNYPECTTYDGSAGCISNGGHSCFNDVTIYGTLSIAESGALQNVTFNEFGIGDYRCAVALDGNVYCSGPALFPDTLGLTIYFDPDQFASLSRNGSTLVLTAPKLAIAALITGNTEFEGPVFFDERIFLNHSGVIHHVGDRIQILGLNITEFLDDVIVRGTTSMFGRIIEQVTLDDNVGVDMYGNHTYLTQQEGDLDVCATNGIVTLCGLNVTLTGTNGIRFNGDIISDVTFVGHTFFTAPAVFTNVTVTNDLNLVNLIVLGTLDVYGVTRLHNQLSVYATTETWHLVVDYVSTLRSVFIGNDSAGILDVGRGALTIIRGPAMFHDGLFVDGSTWPLNQSSFAVGVSSIYMAADTAGTQIQSIGWTNITGTAGMCIGMHDTFAQDPNQRCSIFIDNQGCTNISCLHVNNLIFNQAEVDRLRVNKEFCAIKLSTNDSLPGDERCAIYSNESNTVYTGDTIADSLRLGNSSGPQVTSISTDGTLSGNSNTAIPTEQAVKTYVDSKFGPGNFSTSAGTMNTTLTGFWVTDIDIVIRYSRTGYMVGLVLPAVGYAPMVLAGGFGTTSALPAEYRPSVDIYQPYLIYYANTTIGQIHIAATGMIDFTQVDGGTFAPGINLGLMRTGSVSYITY